MSITSRDRKILTGVVILALALVYWFLIFSPQQKKAADAAAKATQATQRLADARTELARLEQARTSYASDYTAVVRLGKAIPANVDSASLLLQLQNAADGTNIDFSRIATSERTAAPPAAAPAPAAAPGAQPESLGTAAAQETGAAPAPGSGITTAPAAAESAAQTAGQDPTTEVAGARENTKAARDAKTQPEAAAAGQIPAGLEGVGLDFTFTGSFYDLADFFHEFKRFVEVSNNGGIDVSGRLMTIDSLKFGTDDEKFPQITAQVGATAYVSPKATGVTGGATPAGPGAAVPAGATPPSNTAPATTPPLTSSPTPTASVKP